jgi:hypothetical protein
MFYLAGSSKETKEVSFFLEEFQHRVLVTQPAYFFLKMSSTKQFPIIPSAKLDINAVSITKPRKDKNGKLVAYLNHGDGGFMIETPTLHSFGVGRYEDEKKGIVSKYSLTLTQRASNGESEESVAHFFNFLHGLDEKVVDFLIENSETFFKEKLTNADRKAVSRSYKKYAIIKENKDKKTGQAYPDSFRVAFQTQGDEKKGEEVIPLISLLKGKSQVEVSSFEDLMTHVPKNCAVRAVIQPRIYLLADVAGIKFTVRFMKVPEVKKMEMPTEFKFSDADEAEEAAEEVVEDSDMEEVEG